MRKEIVVEARLLVGSDPKNVVPIFHTHVFGRCLGAVDTETLIYLLSCNFEARVTMEQGGILDLGEFPRAI